MAVKKNSGKRNIIPELLEEILDGKIEDKAFPKQTLAVAEQSYQNAGANGVWGKPFGSVGIGSAASFTDNVYKAVIPAFLYKPAFGFPLNKDIPNIRRLAKTPYVAMITNTICNEIASLDWDVIPRDGEKDIPDEIIEQTKNWFYNPNRNDESLDHILRALTRDLIEVDASIIVKVHNLKGEFLEMYARDGGCLDYNTLVETDLGDISIGRIVKDKIKCKVKSWNFSNNCAEWKPIVGWVNNGPATEWVRLWAKSDRKYRSLTSTSHQIWTKDGYKLSEELNVGDNIYTQCSELNDTQKQILLGSLLGDGCITGKGSEYGKYHYKEAHSIKQKDYLLWKMKNFEELKPHYYEYKSSFGEGYPETVKCEFCTEKNIVFEEYRNLKYPEPKKELFDSLNALGLAVWIQDDGYYYYGRGKHFELSTHCFTKEFLEYGLVKLKEKFGLEGKLRKDNRFEDSWILGFNKENSVKLKKIIYPYVHNSMAYKIGEEKLNNEELIDKKVGLKIVETEIYKKEIVHKYDTRYDIEVADNHNFFARGKLVSNTFTKNPDIYGIMPDERAYYQYGWLTGARPIPFNREEIVYFMQNPRTESIYGLSNVEVLNDVLQLLLYGIDSNLEYFSDNNIPKGIFQMIGANADEVKAFQDSWSEQLKKKDGAGNWRKYFHKMPIVNSEGNFVRVGFSNVELELIQQQEWFTKLVWSCFNISPSELGFTENSNKATEFGQNKVVIRKLLKPLVQLIEYNFNTEVVNSLPWIKGKYEDRVFFTFDKYDLQEDLAKRNLFWGDIKNGLRTVNEVREEIDLEPIEGGDELKKPSSAFGAAEGVQGLLDEYGNNSKKKDEVKALTTFSPLTPREFEEMSDPSFLKNKIVSELDEIEAVIKSFLKKEAGRQTLGQVKAIDTNFIKRITELLSLSKLKAAVDGMVKANFFKGLESVEEKLDRNFLPNQSAINFIQDYTFDNVKGMNEELRNDLRQELQRGLMNGEGVPALSKRVSSVMKVGKVRADAIARTESNRAETAGSIDAMRQSGLKVNKTVLATIDDRTSAICKYLNGKTIGLNEKFSYKGEQFDHNPFHVNCRSTLTYEVIE